MLKQAKIKLKSLIYDDSGVAMAYTIMVFLFFFMLCVSTYAMTENIRQKMELQNACDAAAYSGAVVQADMLSRIAVLNRALSWTYYQTSKRHMDYIICDWIENIRSTYVNYRDGVPVDFGVNTSRTYSRTCISCSGSGRGGISGYTINGTPIYSSCSTCGGDGIESTTVSYSRPKRSYIGVRNCHFCLGCGGSHGQADDNTDLGSSVSPAGWFMGWDSDDHININLRTDEVGLWGAGSLTNERANVLSTGIQGQLDDGRNNITTINNAINSLRTQMNNFIVQAINHCMSNNLPSTADYVWNLGRGWGKSDAPAYFENVTNESDFLAYSGFNATGFGIGAGDWWEDKSDNNGIRREYTGAGSGNSTNRCLSGRFRYWATVWGRNPYTNVCHYLLTSLNRATVSNIVPTCTPYFVMPNSRPIKLRQTFFGPDGSIVVAAKRSLFNPFLQVFLNQQDTSAGLYGAFNGTNRDMWVVSSARAGIRFDGTAQGNYLVQWPGTTNSNAQYNSSGIWNLCEEDWDAVMMPIRRTWNYTVSGNWSTGTSGTDRTNLETNQLLTDVKRELSASSSFGADGSFINPINPMRH